MLSLRARAQTTIAQLSPPIRRILLHSLILGLAMSVAELLFNFYLVSLGYAADAAGLFSTIYRAAGVVVGLPIGLLIDRLGSQRSLLLGASVFALGWAIQLTMSAFWALAVCQALIGAASILALTAVVPLLTGVTPANQRASIFGMNAAAALVIGLVGSSIGGLLPTIAASLIQVDARDTEAYRLALGTVVALGFLATVPVLRHIPSEERDLPSAVQEAAQQLPVRTLILYALPSFLLGIGGGALLPFMNLFFRQEFGLSDAVVGSVLAWSALGMGVGAILGSPLATRIGLQRAATWLRFCSAPAILLMLVPFLIPAAAGAFLRGLFIAASYPLNDALVMQSVSPRQRGTAMSLMSVLWSLGWAVAAAISGWSQTRMGFAPALVSAAVAYALSAVAIARMPVPKPAE